jgi:hypothetical protein
MLLQKQKKISGIYLADAGIKLNRAYHPKVKNLGKASGEEGQIFLACCQIFVESIG